MKKVVTAVILLLVLSVAVRVGYDKVTDYMVRRLIIEIGSGGDIGESLSAHFADIPLPTNGNEEGSMTQQSENEKGGQENGDHGQEGQKSSDTSGKTSASSGGGSNSAGTPAGMPANISSEDKAYIMGIYGRYGAGEIAEAAGLMSGGVTAEGKARIKQIVFSKMTQGEYNKLMALYKKYY